MPLALELDPTSEDATNVSLVLTDYASGWRVLELEHPTSEWDSQWAFSAATEGERRVGTRPQNRTVTVRLLIERSTAALLDAQERALGKKVGKLAAEGGTLKMTLPSGVIIIFDIREARMVRTYTVVQMFKNLAEYSLTFICDPYGRGPEVDLGDNVETTLPALIFTETGIKGDVPALGRLVIDDDSAVDQWWLTWGLQSRYYSSATTASLFYEAESRTALGSSAIAAGPSGASGAGSNVMRTTALSENPFAMMSTQASGGGSHLTHIGTFHVYARVQTPTSNTGTVSIALQWAVGDFSVPVTNAFFGISPAWEGTWRLADLGLVTLKRVLTGTQRWEGRILAKSTETNDDIDIDYLLLVPADEGSGIARGVMRLETPSTLSARDEFDQAAGALSGKVAPVGGTWGGAGDGADFAVETVGHTATRNVISDAVNVGRLAPLGTTNFTDVIVQADVKAWGLPGLTAAMRQCVLARYVDASNWLVAGLTTDHNNSVAYLVVKNVAGTPTVLAQGPSGLKGLNAGYVITVRLSVDASGRWFLWLANRDSDLGTPVISGVDPVLATGGALATGKPGLYDEYTHTAVFSRTYDRFWVAVPSRDAAMFASQSLQVRHDGVVHEDQAGAIWTPVASYEGDYLQVPPAGAEGRTTRVVIKGARNDPSWGSDSAIDDISARLFVTPRYFVVPET